MDSANQNRNHNQREDATGEELAKMSRRIGQPDWLISQHGLGCWFEILCCHKAGVSLITCGQRQLMLCPFEFQWIVQWVS